MVRWILQDIKRNLKSRKTFLLLVIVILSIGSLFTKMVNERQDPIDRFAAQHFSSSLNDEVSTIIERMKLHFPYECTFNEDFNMIKDDDIISQGAEIPQKINKNVDCTDYDIYMDNVQKLWDSEMTLDFKTTMELKLFLLDIDTDSFVTYFDEHNDVFQSKVQPRLIDIDTIRQIKQEIKRDISPQFQQFQKLNNHHSVKDFNESAISMYETYMTYVNDYPHNVKYDITGSMFIAHYFNEYFLLLVLIAALVVFDSFYRDYKLGVTKTILSSPMKRSRYTIVKTTTSTISIISVIFIPILITYIALYVYNGYDALNYPIYISRTTLKSLIPVQQFSRVISQYKPATFFSKYETICTHLPVFKYPSDVIGFRSGDTAQCGLAFPYANIQIIILKHYVLLVMTYFILVLFFIATLNTLFSFIFHDMIYNLTILSATIASTLLLNKLFLGSKLLKVIPLTFLSPTALLMGTTPYTFLNGVVTVGLWTVGLIITNHIVMKRKDFPY